MTPDQLERRVADLEGRIDEALSRLDAWPTYAYRGDSGSKSLRRDVRLVLLGDPEPPPPSEPDVVITADGSRWRYDRKLGWQAADSSDE